MVKIYYLYDNAKDYMIVYKKDGYKWYVLDVLGEWWVVHLSKEIIDRLKPY